MSKYVNVELGSLFSFQKNIWNPGKNSENVFLYSIPAYDKGNPELADSSSIKSNKFLVPKNSILFSKLNPKFPRVWLVEDLEKNVLHVASSEFLVLVPNKLEELYFIYYLLRSSPITNRLIELSNGTSNSHQRFLPADLLKVSVKVPSSEIDRIEIGKKLWAIEKYGKQNIKIADDIEMYLESIFQIYITDAIETNHVDISKEKLVFSAVNSKLKDLMMDPHNQPKNWGSKPLTKIATYLNGLPLQKFGPKTVKSDLPVLKIQHLQSGKLDPSEKCNIDGKEAYVIHDGDIVFSWSATLLIKIWVGGKAALNQHLFKVSSDTYPIWFAYFSTKRHMNWFKILASGKATTMGHIQRSHLEQAEVITPSIDYIDCLDTLFKPLWNIMCSLRISNKKIEYMFEDILINFQEDLLYAYVEKL